jgi:hypothetical protein
MVLTINHLEVIKIWGYYTPIQSVTKKPISFMPYWNLVVLQKMMQMDNV